MRYAKTGAHLVVCALTGPKKNRDDKKCGRKKTKKRTGPENERGRRKRSSLEVIGLPSTAVPRKNLEFFFHHNGKDAIISGTVVY